MNSYEFQALRAIQNYHKKHGKYPEQIETTDTYQSAMTCTRFVCVEPSEQGNFFTESVTPGNPVRVKEVIIPVVPLGVGDIVYRRLLVRNTDINREKAECATTEEFQRVGAKLARAGLLIMEPKSTQGLQTYNPHLFFSQIEAWVFGEQAVLEDVVAEEYNQLPGD